MEYRLAIYRNINDFHNIDGYAKFLEFTDLDQKKLKDIVRFTNSFKDEIELKEFLFYYGLITKEDLVGKLYINYYKSKNSKPKVLDYGISYKKDSKLFDYSTLLNHYISKQKNYEFMDVFITKYYEYLRLKPIFSDLEHIYYSNNYLEKNGYLPKGANKALATFIYNYCHKKNRDGSYDINFLHLRDLAMLAIDYERRKTQKQETSIITTIELERTLLNHYKTMLAESALTEGQRENYESEVIKLERKLKND